MWWKIGLQFRKSSIHAEFTKKRKMETPVCKGDFLASLAKKRPKKKSTIILNIIIDCLQVHAVPCRVMRPMLPLRVVPCLAFVH